MAFIIACISPVVSWICQPVLDALQSSLQTAAQDFFSWAVGETIGRFMSRRNAVLELPVSAASIVGAEETLAAIRNHLRDNSVGILGIYGMAGIGKTTLLKKINNDFFESGTQGMFDVVIWITVSKDINILKIQKGIGDRVGLSFSASESDGGSSSSSSSAQIDEQAKLLFEKLSRKRFLLILDDVWAKLDLIKIGIPLPRRGRNCKVAFSTRSLDVCSDMDADRSVKVELLDEGRSWELFCAKVRTERISNPSIQPLAKLVASKCGGLPLALITVGRAMANKTRPSEWKHAIKALDDSGEELRGMDEVLSALKFSYDNLEKDVLRSCLMCCAMYPEDHDIIREELVEYWIGEGLLDDGDDEYDGHVDDARNRGQTLISDLQAACLLEAAGGRYAEHHVRMHDSVRDMALWLNSGGRDDDEVHRFMVFVGETLPRVNLVERWAPVGERLTHVTKMQRWEHVRRLWMRHLNLRVSPPYITNCPNSGTVLLNHTSLGPSVLQGFLDFMRALRVLDLSNAKVEEVPDEIGLLVDLRYLNLSFTRITSLPKQLGNLSRLRQLMLRNTFELRQIPRESIARLSRLQVLDMWFCRYDWDYTKATICRSKSEGADHRQRSSCHAHAAGGVGRQLEVSDLDDLRRLEELWISISNSHALESLSRSDMPWRCTRGLSLDEKWHSGDDRSLLPMALRRVGGHLRQLDFRDDMTHPWAGELRFYLDELPCLETLTLHAFDKEMEVVIVGSNPGCSSSSSTVDGNGMASCVPNLRELRILAAYGLKHLKLRGRFPCLQLIELFNCLGIEDLALGDDDGVRPRQEGSMDSDYPMLKTLDLNNLPRLRSITCQETLLFPSLETVAVSQCPQLRQLPLRHGSAPQLRHIKGTQEWWNALEWDGSDGGGDIKGTFVPD